MAKVQADELLPRLASEQCPMCREYRPRTAAVCKNCGFRRRFIDRLIHSYTIPLVSIVSAVAAAVSAGSAIERSANATQSANTADRAANQIKALATELEDVERSVKRVSFQNFIYDLQTTANSLSDACRVGEACTVDDHNKIGFELRKVEIAFDQWHPILERKDKSKACRTVNLIIDNYGIDKNLVSKPTYCE